MPRKKSDTDVPSVVTTTLTKTRKSGALKSAPTQEQIQRRAYEIYLQRDGAPGNPQEDWIRAERELRGKTPKNGRSSKTKVN